MDAASLTEALLHRGPDGSGVWQSDMAMMVHTRLAILDLSGTGKQPMLCDEVCRGLPTADREQEAEDGIRKPGFRSYGSRIQDGGIEGEGCRTDDATGANCGQTKSISVEQGTKNSPCVLVFNGEIYNHEELRAELEAQGEIFEGRSDTEVLLRLLVREGAECLSKLAGMFAFAFWNEASGEALLARDAYGIKPLYYRCESAGGLTFASEARILAREGDSADPTALRDFFLWGSVPEPQTLAAPIRQLVAGHLMRWAKGSVSVERWHQTSFSVVASSPEDVVKRTRAALEESIRRHLVSDVPVGVFLSGGIDSTAILALARQALGPAADLRTFSIGFEDPEFDESSLARRTAEHFGARHTEWRMTSAEGAAEIPGFLAAMDQPSIDGFNTWCVSKLARREGMKVVLSGLGGDEWFAGYGSFRRVPHFHRLYRMLGLLKSLVASLLNLRPVGSPWRRLAAYLRGGGSWLEAFHAQRGIFTPEEAEQMAETFGGKSAGTPQWTLPALPDDPRAIVSMMEVTRYMRNQLLRDSDVFSMAHGLELRVPLVDVRLAETLLALPVEQRLTQGKQLLLDAVPEIPEWIRNQPKRGFRFPFQQWMEGQFGELLASAHDKSPLPLNAWYRTWAVAVAIRRMIK